MNSQQKSSFVYSPPRSEDNHLDVKNLASDFDNLNIPYHARENSEPFTYFPDPRSQTTMLRSGGLSSPSMVRKILKTTYTDSNYKPQQQQHQQYQQQLPPRQQLQQTPRYHNHHPSPLINELEDILYDSDVEYITRTTSTHNSYREPLKRSNTMDGLSWLAKQQQKLRAKKENKNFDSTDYFQRANYMRSNTVPEVVQRTETVYPTNNETVRYHTITTTSTTPTRREVKEEIVTYHSDPEHDGPSFAHSRPETPAFPTSAFAMNSTPALPPKSPQLHRRLKPTTEVQEVVERTIFDVPVDYAKFVRDTSKFWYKPKISREEAIALLRHAPPGTFLVRDSTTFVNAFGLVVKVAFPPPGVQSKRTGSDELVRHFLIEPTLEGVRLKGCANEPVFSSLSDLVYQHSMTALALPCRLIIPDSDLFYSSYITPAQLQLMTQGAACNILYLYSVDTESLTGPEAVRKAVQTLFAQRPLPKIGVQVVHFKASQQGITLTDNLRRTFFRKHYPARTVSYCGMDPDDHRWSMQMPSDEIASYRIFGFVAKQNFTNICHLFCELEPKSQPATAIVSFVCKMLGATTTIDTNVL